MFAPAIHEWIKQADGSTPSHRTAEDFWTFARQSAASAQPRQRSGPPGGTSGSAVSKPTEGRSRHFDRRAEAGGNEMQRGICRCRVLLDQHA